MALYNLNSLMNVSLIGISTSQKTLFGLEQRVRSRLHFHVFHLHEYSDDCLLQILRSRAEAALTEAGRVPVELQILTTEATGAEVETSNAAFADTIEKSLNESLGSGELVSFSFEVGNPFIVEATIIAELDPTSDEPLFNDDAAEDALSDALGLPVLLDVTIQSPSDS